MYLIERMINGGELNDEIYHMKNVIIMLDVDVDDEKLLVLTFVVQK